MNKEQLKKEQPVVYQTLSNALTRDHLAHAYLFVGPKGSPKNEMAVLLAQSLVCHHTDSDGFACQECDVCQRIQKEEAIDFKWIHGDKNRIKKKDILDLQSFFEATSVEIENRRIYFLEQFDQATPDASNSLLKFLEEPRPGIFAIISADEKSNVLPTIQSRCQWIQFRPASKQRFITMLEEMTDTESAKMLTQFGYTMEQAKEILAWPDFDLIKDSAKKYTMNWDDLSMILSMQREVFVAKSEHMQKEKIRFWLECVLYYTKENKKGIPLSKQIRIQEFLIEAMDMLRRPIELALFLDKLYNQIRKVVIS